MSAHLPEIHWGYQSMHCSCDEWDMESDPMGSEGFTAHVLAATRAVLEANPNAYVSDVLPLLP